MNNILSYLLLTLISIGCNTTVFMEEPAPIKESSHQISKNQIGIVPESIFSQATVGVNNTFSVYIQNQTNSPVSDFKIELAPSYSDITISNNECSDSILEPLQSCRVEFQVKATDSAIRATTLIVSSPNYVGQADVIIKVNDANKNILVNNTFKKIEKNSSFTDILSAYVANGSASGYEITSTTTHGALTINAATGEMLYKPNKDYLGLDNFTFSAKNENGSSNIANYQIFVSEDETRPEAHEQELSIERDSSINIELAGTDPKGKKLVYSIESSPIKGTITGSNNSWTYKPQSGYIGVDGFTFKVSNGTSESTIATVNLLVQDENSFNNPSSNTATTLNSTAGPETEPLVAKPNLTAPVPTGGMIMGGGYPIQTPADRVIAQDRVVTKIQVPVIPTAESQVISLDEDSSVDIELTAQGAGPLTYTILSNPNHGMLTGVGSSWTYTPNPNYTGEDSFTVKVNNGKYDSNVAQININVTAVNEAPEFLDATLTTNEDSQLNFSLPTNDVDEDSLTLTIDQNSTNGTLTYNSASNTFNYVPNNNYTGTDSFIVKVYDGHLSAYKQYDILVQPINDNPTADSQIINVQEDTAKVIGLTGSDIDGDSLTYVIISQPTQGTLSGTGNNVTYTPNSNYKGADSFTFKVNDGQADSAPVIMYLMVTADNQTPVSGNQAVVTPEETNLPITLTGTDGDGDVLTYMIVSQPTHGTLSGTGPTFNYLPSKDYIGNDSFTFKVYDGVNYSPDYTVSISVTLIEDVPTATGANLTTVEDTALSVNLIAQDGDGDALTYIIVSSPSHGTLSGSGSSLTYTPELDYMGPDLFSFKVNDGKADSTIQTIAITVTPVNDSPTALDTTLNTGKNRPKTITLPAIDPDGDTLNYIILTNPANGTLSGSGASWTYTPNTGYVGADAFTFKVNDGQEDSNIGNVVIDVDAINDLPIAASDSVTTPEDTTKAVILQAEDDDNDPLTYTIIASPLHGTLSGSGTNWTYTPHANYFGSDSFKFIANDGTGDSNLATISINVTSVNDAPVADNQNIAVIEDTAKSITLSATDVENHALTYTILTSPLHGTLSGSGAALTYTPDPDYTGPDSFTFRAKDASLNSAPATISLTVSPLNDTPIANDLSFSVKENESYTGSLPAVDFDGDTLTYTIVGTPSQGTVTIINAQTGAFVYTPSSSRVNAGTDSFSFQVFDGTTYSNYGIVSVSITDVLNTPVANNLSITTPQNTPIATTVSATDGDNDSLTYTTVSSPTNGILSFNPNGTFTYTPNNNYNGSDSFTFSSTDGANTSNVATVNISVTFVNTAPVAQNKNIDMYLDQGTISEQLIATDFNNDALTYSVVGSSDGLTINADGSFSFTDSLNSIRTASFQFKANDGLADSNSATLTINIKLRDNFIKLATNPNLVPSAAAEFPLLIDLQTIANLDTFWQNVQVDGGDIVMTASDKTTRLAADVRNFNRANRTGEIWFKSNISANIQNVFYIHYNNDVVTDLPFPALSSTHGGYNVWTNGYMAVWDMTLKNGIVKNAKSSVSDLTPTAETISYSNGYVDEATVFNMDNGTNDALLTDSNMELQTSNYVTVSAWVLGTESSNDQTIVRKYDLDSRPSYGISLDAAKPAFWVGGNSGTELRAPDAISLNKWHYISATYSKPDSRMKLYVDGVLIAQKSYSGVITQTTGKIEIGGTQAGTARALPGIIDQINISSTERTSAWLLAEYTMMSNKNSFWLVEDEVLVASDNFNRVLSNTVGFSWTELEGGSAPASGLTVQQQGMIGIYTTNTANASANIQVNQEMLSFYNLNNPRGYPEAKRAWTAISSGKAHLSFIVDLYRISGDSHYSFITNFGESFKGIGELIWGSPSLGLTNFNGFGVVNKSSLSIDEIKTVNHRELVLVSFDFTNKTYSVYLKGQRRTNIPFEDATAVLNKISFIANEVDSDYVQRLFVDNFVLKKN